MVTALLLMASFSAAFGFATPNSRQQRSCTDECCSCSRLPRVIDSRRAVDASSKAAAIHITTTAIAAAPSSSSLHRSVIAGRISPIFSKLVIDRKKAKKIADSLSAEAHLGEIFLMAAVGLGITPAVRFVYERFLSVKYSERFKRPFDKTRFFQVSKLVARAFQIGSAVYAVDVIDIVLSAMGFRYFQRVKAGEQFAKISFLLWFMLLAKDFKKNLLKATFKNSPNKDGKLAIYDRLTNAILIVSTFMAVLDALKVNMSMALSSLISLGGVGALMVSLASKDLAEQLVSGLAVSTQDRFYRGDEVKLGDGTAGIVARIGWAHTDIRLYDETTVSIPNSDIFNQRVINLSRGKRCQVKQVLRFSYDDIDKMGVVGDAIKEEIAGSCHGLITYGRPLFAHWRDYKSDHLEMVVDCHFEYPPVGTIYWDNRQNVLEAIARATKKCGVEFSLPKTAYVSDTSQAPVMQESGSNR